MWSKPSPLPFLNKSQVFQSLHDDNLCSVLSSTSVRNLHLILKCVGNVCERNNETTAPTPPPPIMNLLSVAGIGNSLLLFRHVLGVESYYFVAFVCLWVLLLKLSSCCLYFLDICHCCFTSGWMLYYVLRVQLISVTRRWTGGLARSRPSMFPSCPRTRPP